MSDIRVHSAERVVTPWWPAAGAAICVALAVVTALLNLLVIEPDAVAMLIAGYALGAVATVIFVSAYRSLRNSRRSRPSFRPQPAMDLFVKILLVVGMLSGIGNAILFAIELSKHV